MEMACHRCDVFNELDSWPSEKIDKATIEIECPNCGALHHMYRGFTGNLVVNIAEDNG